MLAGTHVVVGAWVYRVAEGKPWWIRWPAVVGGGFVSHYFLDSIATYHSVYGSRLWPWDNHWWPWYNMAFIAVQIMAVGAVWLMGALDGKGWRAVMPPMLLSGLWAWLCWDAERFFGSTWLHVEASLTWAPRALSAFSRDPWTGLWEVGLVLGLIVLTWREPGRAEARSGVPVSTLLARAVFVDVAGRRLGAALGAFGGRKVGHRLLRPLLAILILSAVIMVLYAARTGVAAGCSMG